jgi:hypothetical protein
MRQWCGRVRRTACSTYMYLICRVVLWEWSALVVVDDEEDAVDSSKVVSRRASWLHVLSSVVGREWRWRGCMPQVRLRMIAARDAALA